MLTLGWLRYRDLCKLKLLCLAHKAIYTGEPKYLAELLSISTSNRPRRDCHANLLCLIQIHVLVTLLFLLRYQLYGIYFRILFVRQLLDLNSKVDSLNII